MDTLPPRPSNIKYYICPDQRDGSPNNPFTSLIYVNISGYYNTTCKWLPFKSKSGGPHLGTDRSDAAIPTKKRIDDRTTKFLFVSSPNSTTIDVVPIQTSAPPFSKMGQDNINNPSVLSTDRNLQGIDLLRRRT